MRIRATVAAVCGALALTALTGPAAQATGSTPATGTDGTPYTLNVGFSNFKIASKVKVGTYYKVSTTVTYTLTHGADVNIAAKDFYTDPFIYRGSFDDPTKEFYGDNPATCTATSSTTASCKGTIDFYPADGDLKSADAGSWTAAAEAIAFNGQDPANPADMSKIGYKDQDKLGTTLLQRVSKLTTDASPEPVKKGGTITVTGTLTRASWDYLKYYGYSGQSVKLQFRKAGTSTYTTLKTVTTDSSGRLKATVTASADGYFRYSFGGTSTTAAVSATGDYVDVQ
ncbi:MULTISPECIES: hypothetical protein [unclassified Streptomyces]|uniref:hypothetical protein n=1 Tax=unclassified Streptomyces TaxID=2593676 RepID=UPI0027405B2F|nr:MULTISPECIES: hypothetical protein [unclassified Streptomyces]